MGTLDAARMSSNLNAALGAKWTVSNFVISLVSRNHSNLNRSICNVTTTIVYDSHKTHHGSASITKFLAKATIEESH